MRLAFVAVIALSQTAAGAELRSTVSKENKVVISLSGEITDGDSDRLKALISAANTANRLVSGIRLSSPGGQLAEGVKLADAIRFAKIATVVPNGAICASACFIAFASGSEKFVSYSAQVGVHGASDKTGNSAGDATIAMAKIVKNLGVTPSVIGKMVVTPPDQMVWLDPNELRSLGTTMTGKPAQTTSAPLGIPTDIQPQTQAAITAKPPSWSALTDAAFNLSKSQNGGSARTGRSCQPEIKLCTTAVFFKSDAGVETMIRVAEDISGKIISRDVCTFNGFGDVRTCLNWETGVSKKAMRNVKNEWVDVD